MARDGIAYYLPRINSLKLFGPLLHEQFRRRLPLNPMIVVPVAPLASTSGKMAGLASHQFMGQIRKELGDAIVIEGIESGGAFFDLIQRANVRAVIHVGLDLPENIVDEAVAPSRARGVAWCSVGHLGDELLRAAEFGPDVLAGWDFVGTIGPDIVRVVAEIWAERYPAGRSLLERLVPIGFVELDQLASIDPATVRRKYGIPESARTIFFSTAPRFGLPRSLHMAFFEYPIRHVAPRRLARLIWGRRWPGLDYLATYPQILGALRRYANRHSALVLAKTRAKHRDLGYVERTVDRLYGDGSYHPFRTLELIAACDLYAGVSSASSLEALFVGRRIHTMSPWPENLGRDVAELRVRDAVYDGPKGVWSDSKLSSLYPTFQHSGWRSLEQWSRVGEWDTEVDSLARSRQVTRVFGFDDHHASRRFMDRLEACLR